MCEWASTAARGALAQERAKRRGARKRVILMIVLFAIASYFCSLRYRFAAEKNDTIVGDALAQALECRNPVLFAGHDPNSKNEAWLVYEEFSARATLPNTPPHCALWFDLASPL